MTILLYAAIAIIGTLIIWKGSSLLETASERLAVYYKLPDIVTGAIVVAVGSSFPELSATVISTLVHGEFELGVSAIVGSAIFNVLVIPGLSGLASKEPLRTNRDLVYKEAQFYMLSVAVLLITFAFATIYRPVTDAAQPDALLGEMTRGIAIIPIVLYGLYIWVQWQDTMDIDIDESPEKVSLGKEWLRLLGSLLLILVGVEALVQSALKFGEILHTPSYLWGITVIAAGTSIPDAFVSVRAARVGKEVTSVANVLGSNIFDLLICVPVGVMIAGTAVINFSVAAPMMAVLTAATLVLFLAMRTNLVISRFQAGFLLFLYGVFVVWISLESTNVIDTIRGLPPVGAT